MIQIMDVESMITSTSSDDDDGQSSVKHGATQLKNDQRQEVVDTANNAAISMDELGAGDKNLKIHSYKACVELMLNALENEYEFEENSTEKNDSACNDYIMQNEVEEQEKQVKPVVSNEASNVAECPIDSVGRHLYSDVGSLQSELSEIYAYYEMSSFYMNKEAFQWYLSRKNQSKWSLLSKEQKLDFIQSILEDCELVNDDRRCNAIWALTYLSQGCWGELRTLPEQLDCIIDNVKLMLKCNAFWSVWMVFQSINSTTIDLWNRRKNEQTVENCLSILCTMMISPLKDEDESDSTLYEELIIDLKDTKTGIQNFFTALMQFVVGVAEFNSSCFLLKKVLIILRYYLLLTLGDFSALRKKKDSNRMKAGLKPQKDDTLLVCESIGVLQDSNWWNEGAQRKLMNLSELQEVAQAQEGAKPSYKTSFPWHPKSSLESFSDVSSFLAEYSQTTHKFQRNLTMPPTLKQKLDLLIKHLYIPLGDFQKEQEELISKYPTLFAKEEKIASIEVDNIFAALLPNLDDTLESLRKILAETTPRKSLRSFNEYFVPMDADPTYYDEDRFRQSEIVTKAISSILILLLKHLKANHIYQFECLTTELFSSAYIPTIMRFFNRDLIPIVSQRSGFEDPGCLFKVMFVESTPFRAVEIKHYRERGYSKKTSPRLLLQRNVYSYTNLLRILNKLVKGNPCRIRALQLLNPMESFKRALNVRDPFFQQYLLKLIKPLCKFAGPDWKKANLHILTGIYYKLRHRILENWLGETLSSGKGKKTKSCQSSVVLPWEFSKDEIQLVKTVISYVKRRFGFVMGAKCEQVPTTTQSLREPTEKEYQEWLNSDSGQTIDWDSLIQETFIV